MADPAVVEKKWLDLYRRVTGEEDQSRFSPARNWLAFLRDRYGALERHYHNLDHIGYMRELLHIECRDLVNDIDAVEWAIWFHDVFYETKPPMSNHNEELSAYISVLDPNLNFRTRVKIQYLINATYHDQTPPVDGDSQLIVDLDLTILGTVPDMYDVYEKRIRNEYSWVPEELYRTERAKVLQGFLDRESIYLTDFWRDQRETQAQENLAVAIEKLTQ